MLNSQGVKLTKFVFIEGGRWKDLTVLHPKALIFQRLNDLLLQSFRVHCIALRVAILSLLLESQVIQTLVEPQPEVNLRHSDDREAGHAR